MILSGGINLHGRPNRNGISNNKHTTKSHLPLFGGVLVLEEPSVSFELVRNSHAYSYSYSHGSNKKYSLANKVIHSSKCTNSTRCKTNKFPRELSIKMLPIRTKAQTSTNKSQKNRITDVDRVTRVGSKTTALRLARLGLLRLLFTDTLALFLLGFTLKTFGLGGGFHILFQKFRIHSLHVRGIDVNERSGAFRLVFVDATDIRGATVSALVWSS